MVLPHVEYLITLFIIPILFAWLLGYIMFRIEKRRIDKEFRAKGKAFLAEMEKRYP